MFGVLQGNAGKDVIFSRDRDADLVNSSHTIKKA